MAVPLPKPELVQPVTGKLNQKLEHNTTPEPHCLVFFMAIGDTEKK